MAHDLKSEMKKEKKKETLNDLPLMSATMEISERNGCRGA
jgi:hypothetical protein